MKKIRVVLLAVVGTVLLAMAAIWILANPNRYRDVIQAQLEKELSRKVSLGEMSLGFLPLRFQVANPIIEDDPAIGRQMPFVRADKLDVRIELLPLLQGKVNVDSLDLRRPSVEFVKTRKGVWNVSTLGVGASSPAASSKPSENKESGFSLDKLTILDGQISVSDLQRNQRSVYDHIDLTLLNYASGKPFSFELVAHIQGDGAQEIRVNGEAGPLLATNPTDTPFHGKLNLKQVGIDGLFKFLDTTVITKAKGTLSGESEIASQQGTVSTQGKVRLDNAHFNDLDIGYPIGLDYKLTERISDGVVNIDGATLTLGPTPLTVAGSLNTTASPPTMDLKVQSGEVSIAEIARLASAFGVAFAPGTSVTGRVSTDVRAKGSAIKPTLNGSIHGRDLEISGQSIPQPVQVKAIDLALTPTAIQSNEFNATSGKTSVSAQFSLLQYASSSPSINIGMKAPGATLPEIQAIAKAYGITGLDQLSGDGTLNFDLHAKGALDSLTTAEATKALNGVINLNFSPLKIAGFDTAQELGKLAGFTSSGQGADVTDIVKVAGQILVKDGIAQTNDLLVQLPIGNLTASGTADLVAEVLNLKVTSIFSKAFTDKFGGTRVGGLMNSALTNNNGELVLPAIVTGSFKQPKFAPDLKAVADMQKQRLNPANLLDTLTGKTNNSEDAPAGEKPAGIKGLLKSLTGKKPNPPR